MDALSKSFAYEHIPTEVEKLQVQIAELIVANERLSNQLTNTTFDTNDVISYLKKTVEEKDEELARLEEIEQRQCKERETVLKAERQRYEDKEKEWNAENEKLNTEISIMNTQLGSQQRLEEEVVELKENLKELKKQLSDQAAELEERVMNERTIRVEVAQQARNDLLLEFAADLQNMKEEFELRKSAELKMNQKIIEQLNVEIQNKTNEISRMDEMRRQAEEMNETLNSDKENLQEEVAKLRQLLEKSRKMAEKSVKDTKKRLEDSEKRRTKLTTEYNETIVTLKKEISELQENLKRTTNRCDRLEKGMAFEQKLRESTILAHSSQNEKVHQLRKFLKLCLGEAESSVDDVLGESRHAVFSKLSLIVSQIPIVK